MNGNLWPKAGIFLTGFVLTTSLAFADSLNPHKAGSRDKCPVCGMFVAKYPDFAAQIGFQDGSTFHFDGAKDMFKFYLAPSRYVPGKQTADITAIFVTSYYDLSLVDGRTAFYVAGSDIYGPMGGELIPFTRQGEARDFMKDHKGKKILGFREVDAALLRSLHR